MRSIVSHEVMFFVEPGDDPGPVYPAYTGYGRVTGATIRFYADREPHVHVHAARCRKDGNPDQRIRTTNAHIVLPAEDEAVWVERARTAAAWDGHAADGFIKDTLA